MSTEKPRRIDSLGVNTFQFIGTLEDIFPILPIADEMRLMFEVTREMGTGQMLSLLVAAPDNKSFQKLLERFYESQK